MSIPFQTLNKGYGLKDKIDFGKYNGAFVQDVANDDPEYLAWMYTQAKKPLTEETKLELVTALLDIISDLKPNKLNRINKIYLTDTYNAFNLEDDIPF